MSIRDITLNDSITILDTDMGVDDALAMVLASRIVHENLIILTSFGNVSEPQALKNACILTKLLDVEIQVFSGSQTPLMVASLAARDVHGEDGLGGATSKFDASKFGSVSGTLDDVLALVQSAKAPINWISIGPATNLAHIIEKLDIETVREKLTNITLMSGVFFDVGNITPYAEFNAASDPDALGIVLESTLPLSIVPLDICRKIQFRIGEIISILSSETDDLQELLVQAHKKYCAYYNDWEGFNGCFPHDSIAVIAALQPNDFFFLSGTARCEVKNKSQLGKTSIQLERAGPHKVFMGGNLKRVRQIIEDMGLTP